jgi:hypothetical protein
MTPNNGAGTGNCDGHGDGCGPIRAAGQQPYNYWHAFIGKVLGTSGVTTAAVFQRTFRHGNYDYSDNSIQ